MGKILPTGKLLPMGIDGRMEISVQIAAFGQQIKPPAVSDYQISATDSWKCLCNLTPAFSDYRILTSAVATEERIA